MQEEQHGPLYDPYNPEQATTAETASGTEPEDRAAESPTAVEAAPPASSTTTTAIVPAAKPVREKTKSGGGGNGSNRPPSGGDGGDDEDDGMLRMSFLEHLEELRGRILKAILGLVVAFAASLYFAGDLWNFVSAPARSALEALKLQPQLVQITPMETFTTVYLKLPLLAAVFLASPWILYQVWAFVAPGLYRRERRWAAPFVICSAGLFILGGAFAYFVAFRYALTFLLGLGRDIHIAPMVSITEYFDLFVNVMLGIGLVFELPVLIFFLTLLRIVTPRFLLRNTRYAILIICIIAAIVTPTPDIFNMMLFAVPMCALFFVGIFAGYLLVLHREHRRFPWKKVLPWVGVTLVILAAVTYFVATKYYHLHFVPRWPLFVK